MCRERCIVWYVYCVFTSCWIACCLKKQQQWITESVNENISAGFKSNDFANWLHKIWTIQTKPSFTKRINIHEIGSAVNHNTKSHLAVRVSAGVSCGPHEAQHVTWAYHTAASRMRNMNSPLSDFQPDRESPATCFATAFFQWINKWFCNKCWYCRWGQVLIEYLPWPTNLMFTLNIIDNVIDHL